MDLRFVICAQSLALDQRNNAMSLFHIIEELNIPAFPFALPYMAVVALFQRTLDEPNEPEGIQLVLTHGEQELVRQPLAASFQGRLRMRAIAEIAGMVVPGPGVINVTIEHGERQRSTWPIVVNNIARPVVQPVLQM